MWYYGAAILGVGTVGAMIFGKPICNSIKSYISKKLVNMVLTSNVDSNNKLDFDFIQPYLCLSIETRNKL